MATGRIFGTLFFANYLTRVLALYRSLEERFDSDFKLTMLCMDDEAVRVLERLQLPKAELLRIRDLERSFPELAAVRTSRSIAEFSWTTTPFLLLHLLGKVSTGEPVVYLDADMMFYSDPQPIFDEWGANAISIHEHRYAPQHQHHERQSGRFNVGWVGVRNNDEGNRCVARWASQCIELCVYDPERGLCGDQRYLEEWPARYEHLTIIQHKGAGLGPWNFERYALSAGPDSLLVDGMPIIFYHFSSLRVLANNLFGHMVIIPAVGYRFSAIQRRLVYRPYAARLKDAYREMCSVSSAVELVKRKPKMADLRAARLGIMVV
jgi:hypothetical protein